MIKYYCPTPSSFFHRRYTTPIIISCKWGGGGGGDINESLITLLSLYCLPVYWQKCSRERGGKKEAEWKVWKAAVWTPARREAARSRNQSASLTKRETKEITITRKRKGLNRKRERQGEKEVARCSLNFSHVRTRLYEYLADRCLRHVVHCGAKL